MSKYIGDAKMTNNLISTRTVKLIARIIKPFVEENIIIASEEQEILRNLRHLATKGSLAPAVEPRLIDQKQAAEMLGLSHSNFKKLEKENAFWFNRKMVGSAVRYRNIDVINYIMAEDEDPIA
jgi:predicted DNA-binding transcriptional regulator AlpA